MSDFDALTEQMIAAAEKDILPYLEVEHINQRLELREKQLQELTDVSRKNLFRPRVQVCRFSFLGQKRQY